MERQGIRAIIYSIQIKQQDNAEEPRYICVLLKYRTERQMECVARKSSDLCMSQIQPFIPMFDSNFPPFYHYVVSFTTEKYVVLFRCQSKCILINI